MAVATKRDFSISYGLQTDKTGSSTGNTLFVDQVNDRVAVGLNNPSEKFEVSGNIKLSDDNILKFGTNNDLQIYYDGTLDKTIIHDSSGELKIQSDGNISFTKGTTENLAVFEVDGAVKLYYDNNLKFETTSSGVDIDGDLKLDDGGAYSTTLQMVTATANRTISFPDATGTVALVAGSNGQLIYNSFGAQAGLSTLTTDGTDITLTGRFISSLNGAASEPPGTFTGTWFTGGTSTTTKPQLLIEPSGTTSTAWSTSGTGLGVNAPSGFTGRLLDLQLNGTSNFSVNSTGTISTGIWEGTAIDVAYLDSTVVTTDDTGTVTSTMILNGTIVNDDINASAAIAGVKIDPDFGSQNIETSGDINLNDGGAYSTTLQMVTATANRTISFPDATGTVALVAGSSGQLTYNSSGAQAGLTSASIGSTGEINISLTGAASTPPVSFTGSWFTGGTATTTKPQLLIEPSGTTSTAWSTSGTGLGVNAASGFSGRLLDLQTNGTSQMVVQGDGKVGINTTNPGSALEIDAAAATSPFIAKINTSEAVRIDNSGRLLVGTSSARSNFYGLTVDSGFQTERTQTDFLHATFTHNDNGATGPYIGLAKQRSNSVGGNTIVQSGDQLGGISFLGSDGSNFIESARVQSFSDGTPGTNDMPGRLVFSVTADGSASPTEALRISNDRSITVSDGGDVVLGTTTGTKIGTATSQKIGFYNATPVVQPTAVADITTTATSGSLPTPDGSVTIADAATPTVTELLEYCVELEAKLEAALGHLRTLGLIAT